MDREKHKSKHCENSIKRLRSLSITELEDLVKALPIDERGAAVQELRVKQYFADLKTRQA